jgi:hypothetical protein
MEISDRDGQDPRGVAIINRSACAAKGWAKGRSHERRIRGLPGAGRLSFAARARNVTMQNPRTGEAVICRQSLGGLDPWSQTGTCVASYLAQGCVQARREMRRLGAIAPQDDARDLRHLDAPAGSSWGAWPEKERLAAAGR